MMSDYMYNIKKKKHTHTQSGMVVTRGWSGRQVMEGRKKQKKKGRRKKIRRRKVGRLLPGARGGSMGLLFCKMKRVLRRMMVMVAIPHLATIAPQRSVVFKVFNKVIMD